MLFKTELRIMTPQTKLLTVFFFKFKLVNQCDKNFNSVLVLVTQDF